MSYQGLSGVSKFVKDYIGIILTTKGTTQTIAVAKTAAGWKAIIAPATTGAIAGVYIPVKGGGYENKTKAVEETEGNTGFMYKTNEFPPAIDFLPVMTEEDYMALRAIDSTEMDVVFVRKDGKLDTAVTTAGLQKGFAADVYIDCPVSVPGGAEKLKAYPIRVKLQDFEEWQNKVVIQPSFTIAELAALTPIGYNVEIITPYEASGKTVVVKVTKRGTKTSANPNGDPVSILTTTSEWEITSHGDTGGAITTVGATLAGTGLYTLTVTNSAAAMTAPFYIRGFKVVSSSVAYITNIIKVVTP